MTPTLECDSHACPRANRKAAAFASPQCPQCPSSIQWFDPTPDYRLGDGAVTL